MKRLRMFTASFPASSQNGHEELNVFIESLRAKAKLPALGVAVVVGGKLECVEVAGFRKRGEDQPVTCGDKWHIGSCTKAMTATLAATFVEEGLLSWEASLDEVFGGALEDDCLYREVTLLQLLTHRSGIPGAPPSRIWADAWDRDGEGSIREQRADFADAMLGTKPLFTPGAGFEYSNAGYVVAGIMMEFLADASWEELMRKRIFEPLGMTSAGFGNAARKGGGVDQPWPHGAWGRPKAPGQGDDNPAALGPAGTVHCSLADLATFVKMHLLRETGAVIRNESSYETLHRVIDLKTEYACGWILVERDWAGEGPAMMHNGSNTMNYCVVWLAPARGFAAIVVTNAGNGKAERTCDEVTRELIRRYLPAVPTLPLAPDSHYR